jgi:hypothetical protein
MQKSEAGALYWAAGLSAIGQHWQEEPDMNMLFKRTLAGAFAGTLLTMSLATSASAAPLSVATPVLVAPHSELFEAKYVRHHRVVRHYRYRYRPGIGRALGGLLSFGLGTVFGPSCPYYYSYPYYYGGYYCGPYYYGAPYYHGPRYRRVFRGHAFVGRPVFRGGGRAFVGRPAFGGGRGFARGGGGGFARGGGGGRGGHGRR